MKALSLKQPWAWALFNGKDVENRKWKTRFRGRFLVHASRNYDEEGHAWIARAYESGRIVIPWPPPISCDSDPAISLGAIIGSVELVDCVVAHESPWFFGPYGFVLRDPVKFKKAILYSGKLHFFEVPDEVVRWDGR